jgi:hypothetical protein
MGSKSLPDRPQWFKDTIATLRAQRSDGAPPHEFGELAADEILKHPDYVRGLARTDALSYDAKVTNQQSAEWTEEMAAAVARGFMQPSMLPAEALARLGLDPELDLGFGNKVLTVDATPEDRMKAIAELERSKESWAKGRDKKIAAIEALNELAGGKTLREIIDDLPDEEYGAQ